MKHYIFSMEKSAISLNGHRVFSNLNLSIYCGEILGIICGSATEQNTIVSLFRGNCHIDGTLKINSKDIPGRLHNSVIQENIYVIDQRKNLINSFSIAENIFIFSDANVFVHQQEYQKKTQALLDFFHINLNLTKPVHELSNLENILVQLLKAYVEKRHIIVLSAITEIISAEEFEQVKQLMAQMLQHSYAFIIIDSIESNIFSNVDEVLVIKNRTSVACFRAEFFNQQTFYRYMLKGRNSEFHDELSPLDFDDTDLVSCFSLVDFSTTLLEHISLQASCGELLKILCLDEKSLHGFQELGGRSYKQIGGSFCIGSITSTATNSHRFSKQMIDYCPVSPWQNLILPNLSVRDNLLIGLTEKVFALWMKKRYSDNVDLFIHNSLHIDKPSRKAYHLSSASLQQIAYSRFLLAAPKLVVIDRPFIEADLQVRSITNNMIHALLNRGITVLLLTTTVSDLALLDGEDYYCKDGRLISEEEMYQSFYSNLPEHQ